MYRYASLFPRIPDPTEVLVEKLLTPVFPHLWWCVNQPWDEWLTYRLGDSDFRDYGSGEIAEFMQPKMVRRARDVEAILPDFRAAHLSNQKLFVFKDQLAIIFKKITRTLRLDGTASYRLSSYPTGTNDGIWEQRALPLFPALPRIAIGYVLDVSFSKIKTVVGFSRKTARVLDWWFPIPDQGAAAAALFNKPLVPAYPAKDMPDRRIIVEPKEGRKRGVQ
jgi:hypothetical protein